MKSYKNIRNILMISTEFPPGPGGIGNHAWNLAKELNNHFPTHILTISDYSSTNECVEFDSMEKLYVYRFKRYKIILFTVIKRIFDIIKHCNQYNYSHCILSGKFALWMSLIIKLFYHKMKLIGVLHGTELLPSKRIYRSLIKKCLLNLDIAISVSNFTNSLIPNHIAQSTKRIIIPNGVNVHLLDNCYITKEINKLKGNPVLLTVGSITDRKGQSNLINALPLVLKSFPKAHYHCIGLPIEADKLLIISRQLRVHDNLTLHGFIPNKKLGQMYKQADILIMLSHSKLKTDTEGFGIAILEANLFGVPAIGSIKTGIEDAIKDGETGILVNPYSEREILDAIDNILINRSKFSKNSSNWAQNHKWDEISIRYIEVINNA